MLVNPQRQACINLLGFNFDRGHSHNCLQCRSAFSRMESGMGGIYNRTNNVNHWWSLGNRTKKPSALIIKRES